MPRSSKRRLRVETLETRTTPATATLSAGTLSVVGTIGNDTITVQEAGGLITVTGVKINHGGVLKNSVPVGIVARVFVNTGRGDDTIDISTVTKKGTVIAGIGDDNITGGLGIDDLYGREGNDTIAGGGGNDKLYGENDDDTISGDSGNDQLFAGIGDDILAGNAGDDLIYGEAGNDQGNGGDGKDKLLGNVGDDSLAGGTGNDDVQGEGGNDELSGDDGNDSLNGGDGNDTITGLLGDDEILGMAGNDSLDGGDGADSIYGGAANDKANGGAGDDLIKGETGDDTLHGDAGNDIVAGGLGSDFVFGDDGSDIVAANVIGDVVNGGPGNDTISAGDGDVVDGGGGTDTVISGGGDDDDDGGGGGGGGDGGGGTGGGTSTTGTVFQSIRQQWDNGGTNDIALRNTGTGNMVGWKIEFDADFDIYEWWNTQLISNTGGHYVFESVAVNRTIRPNNLIVFGFNTRLEPGDSTAIRNIMLNGVALTPGGPPPPTPTPGSRGTVVHVVRNQWVDGSTNDIIIRNTGTTNMVGWTITFEADFDISPSNVWNAQLIGRSGNTYTIRSNTVGFTTIRPNTQITIGFNAFLSEGDSSGIRNVTLNGNAV